jgi:hypothetical protein
MYIDQPEFFGKCIIVSTSLLPGAEDEDDTSRLVEQKVTQINKPFQFYFGPEQFVRRIGENEPN